MPKQTITMTRDLFDEILEATTTKERERIIKLINFWADPEEFSTIDDLIALIKEEQNA